MFRLNKNRIFFLYQHCLLSDILTAEQLKNQEEKEILLKKEDLEKKIEKELKTGWTFKRLKPLERAILLNSYYELTLPENKELFKLIIDQTINFSKSYLEKDKFKYINKVLDNLAKKN